MMTNLKRVLDRRQILDLVTLAREIWTEHYVAIIGKQQVDFMLDKFQSDKAIADQIAGGYEYYIMAHEGKSVGYLAIIPDAAEDTLMISKIYVTKSSRGQGFGRMMLEFVENVCRERRIKTLWLTVNKNNAHAIAWYSRMGFQNAGPTIQDIGGGFVMDDYRMQKTIVQRSRGTDTLLRVVHE
jgi:ribosomal protein S18 acetylase RimI-like enzyme